MRIERDEKAKVKIIDEFSSMKARRVLFKYNPFVSFKKQSLEICIVMFRWSCVS